MEDIKPEWLGIETNPQHGLLTLSNDSKSYTYVPGANWNGSDMFSYKVKDSSGTESTGVITVVTNPINDAPTASNITSNINEDTQLRIKITDILNQSHATDVDGDILTISSIQDTAHGQVVLNGTDIIYTPDANYNGVASFNFTISDGHGGIVTQAANININAINDAPNAANITAVINEDTQLKISIVDILAQSRASDVDGDTLTISSVQAAAHGQVLLKGTDIIYTPDLST